MSKKDYASFTKEQLSEEIERLEIQLQYEDAYVEGTVYSIASYKSWETKTWLLVSQLKELLKNK
jgi:hypothetical protein